MEQLLSQHDFVYERSPMEWLEGIPIANGRLGAMIWGDGCPLHFTLDHYDVWETRTLWPGDDPQFTYENLRRLKEEGRIDELNEIALRRRNMRFIDNPPPYPTRLSLGRMELKWPESCKDFNARLDLLRACVSGTISLSNSQVEFLGFIHSLRDVLVFQVRGANETSLPSVSLVPAASDEFSERHFRSWGYPEAELEEQPSRRILRRRYSDGKEYSIVMEESRTLCELTVFLTIVQGDEGGTEEEALRRISEVRGASIAELLGEHEEDWRRFWEKSAISIPDSLMENLYYAEMYKHYCSSRPGPGHIPVTLQGVWTTDGSWPPWRGSYTTDMNVEESYWPIYTSNHLESGEPLYEMYWRNLPLYRKMGEYWYGREIAIITGEHSPGGEPFPGYFTDEHSPGAGAWISYMFWLHWLYSRDRWFLRERAYPFMREMIQGYLHIIEKRDDGKYHIPFTDSPEFYCGRPDSLGDDSNYDLALLRFLLGALLDSQKELAESDPDCERWMEVQRNLVDFPVVPTGGFTYDCMALAPNQEVPDWWNKRCLALRSGEPLPHSHRHHSHLIGIYPLGVIAPARSEGERTLVEGSIEDLIFKGTGEWMGWSFPWASMIAGRAGKSWMAYHFLKTYIEGFVTPNSLHTNHDFRQKGISFRDGIAMTLEAGFAAAAAVLEMLLQSHHGLIRIFPTCPPIWADAQFLNLRAEGAFLVSARKRGHRVLFVEIQSEVGETCRILNPFGGDCSIMDMFSGSIHTDKGEILEFPTKPGGRYRLASAGVEIPESDILLEIIERSEDQRNWFGLKSHERF